MLFKPQRVLSLLVALFLVASASLAGEFNTVAEIGQEMPQFSDLPSIDDSRVSSANLEEEVVVLVFLANHCPWVKGMDGDLVAFVDAMAGDSVRVVGVSVNHREDDRLPAMKIHAKENGYNFTYVYDESQELGRALGATKTPEYFVFDKDRKLVYMGLIHNSPAMIRSDGGVNYTKGEPTEFYLNDAVRATLAGGTVDPAETAARGCSVVYEKAES